ncbi:MFS transporter [Halomarina pelagica]|uniref:MFS transporter n=1 Tax=Halomarina pelagica TaxID=2961599 RepID=UPI0020C2447C|nr:MFS transporter [Halomarina sp. BND7]
MNSNDRAITGFTMLAHALFHTYELSIPVFVVAWLDAFSVTPATMGLVVGAGYALVGVGALPSGVFSDRFESRRLIVGALLGMAAGFAALSVAPNVYVVALALALWGAAASVYHPAGLALLSRGTTERGAAFAYHGAAGNVGTVVGPLLAAVGLAVLDWRVVTGLFVLPALLGAAMALRLDFDETAAIEDGARADGGAAAEREITSLGDLRRESRALFTGSFLLVFAVIMCYGLYYRGVLTFLPDILGGLRTFSPATVFGTTVQPGQYVYAGLLLVGVAGQYVGGRLTDSFDTVRVLVITFAALAVSSLLFLPAAAAGVLPLLAVCVLLGFLIYVVAPVYQATVADHVHADVRGLSYGYTYLGMFGVGAGGAALAGAVLTWAGTGALFVVLAGIVLLAAGLGIALLRR